MNNAYDSDDDLQDLHDAGGRDREISLGTSTILGIFFALALICAAFFGFGYSLGRRSAQPTANTAEAATDSSFSSFKPAPGSATAHPASISSTRDASDTVVAPMDTPSAHKSSVQSEDQTVTQVAAPRSIAPKPVPDAPIESAAKPVIANRPAQSPNAPSPSATPQVGASAVVQVAAVSHQEDADMLLSALKRKGYNVAIRQEPQDKLLHVQIGPFANKKEAEVMRQRLLADGYNAIVK